MLKLGERLWRSLTPKQRKQMILLVGAVIIMASLEVVNVSAIAPFLSVVSDPTTLENNAVLSFLYDSLRFQDFNGFLITVGVGIFGLMLLSNAWATLTTWAQLRLVWSWNHQLSVRLLESYLNRPYSYFLTHNTADLSKNLLSEVQQLTNQVVRPLILAAGRAVAALGIVVALFVMNPLLALLVTLVVGGSYGAIYTGTRKKLNALGRDRVKANSERFTVAGEAFGGIKEVKVMNLEHSFIKRYIGPSYRFSRHQATSQAIATLPRHAIETVAFGTIILIAVYLIAAEQNLSNIVPTLGLYAFAGYRLMPALQEVFNAVTSARFYGAALNEILEDLESGREVSQYSLITERQDVAVRMGLKRQLELRDLYFSYPGADRPAVNGISLTIRANSAVGIVGITGSGKTTLVDVILGLLNPQSGEILVDGVPITSENLLAWQRSLGYVPQSIFLSDASVAENIAFGVPRDQIDMEAVRAAARIAQIDDFVMQELPQKYDTVVGERGVRLSGGQRQRIGIARALYRNPDVIIFDEATSALDSTTEDYVMEAIKQLLGNKTIIMIAHRTTTLSDCDEIVLIEKGEIRERGCYSDLVTGAREFGRLSRFVTDVSG